MIPEGSKDQVTNPERMFEALRQELPAKEYDALRAEERDRMNGRAQVWTTYLTIVGACGFAATQSGPSVYVVALCPPLLACLARFSRHSEDVLKQMRKYLYSLEVKSGYEGYEHFTRTHVRKTNGGYRDALRDAFLLTDFLTFVTVLVRIFVDHVFLALPVVLIVDVFAIVLTCIWLSKSSRRRGGHS